LVPAPPVLALLVVALTAGLAVRRLRRGAR
jgi:hypothetical protein